MSSTTTRLERATARACRPIAALLILFAALGSAACTTQPVPVPPPSGVVDDLNAEFERYQVAGRATGLAKARLVSLCYSSQLNLPQQVSEFMEERCGGAPERRYLFYGEDTLLTPCPLFQPIRMTFVCYDTRVRTVMPPRPGR